MSLFVLHMDKFKKEAVRGIQSHNLRERESRSNPDIDYGRSAGNYELHGQAAEDYSGAIQNRIDDLLLTKAVRKDAVHMCGLIVSSDSAFFEKLSQKDTRRFFEESKAFLTEFVGAENVISAMVHMDEKTPHMHFLHVPVTPGGRLSAKTIYTRENLKKLQTELPKHLQNCGFTLQRGVEQEPGAAKKHLDTREFKQQQEALHNLEKKVRAVTNKLKQRQQEESELLERLQSYQQQAQDAEKELAAQTALPQASMFNFKSALETASSIIERQKKALAEKSIVAAHNKKLRAEVHTLREEVDGLNKKMLLLAKEKDAEIKSGNDAMLKWMNEYKKVFTQLEEINKFFRWNQEADKMFLDYRQQEQERAARAAAEQKRQAQEKERREREERERKEAEQAREEKEREEKREREKAEYLERRARGMGMFR